LTIWSWALYILVIVQIPFAPATGMSVIQLLALALCLLECALVIKAGYPQYISIRVNNMSGRTLNINRASLSWGKWYLYNNKDIEGPGPNGQTIAVGANRIIAQSCGRQYASSGTTGSLYIYDFSTDQKITKFSWDCPYGSNTNSFGITETNKACIVMIDGGNINGGAIGEVRLSIYLLKTKVV